MSTAILFKKCLGLNDSGALGSQKMITDPRDPEAGTVELLDCLNMTTTADGCVEKIPALTTVLTHGAAITACSAKERFLFQDAIDTWEWLGGINTVQRLPLAVGPIAHTPLDVRVAAADHVYKSVSPAGAMQQAGVGVYSGPPVSKPFFAMPDYSGAFIHHAKLYAINRQVPRFLQYSEDYHYDLFAIGDNHLPHVSDILQAGSIPGVLLTTHESGVTVYKGSGPHDFARVFYPCTVLDRTLYSGFISKVYGYGHVFTCGDGVYLVDQSGALVNLTVDATDHLDSLNDSYSGAIVHGGKYRTFGNAICIEYDFKTKTVMKQAAFAVTGATLFNDLPYYSQGDAIVTPGTTMDSSADFACGITLPFSSLGAAGRKALDSIYFSGEIGGLLQIIARDQTQGKAERWRVNVWSCGAVQNYRIKLPSGTIGSRISFEFLSPFGTFRLEEARLVFGASKRS